MDDDQQPTEAGTAKVRCELAVWLLSELDRLPPAIKAVYVEWGTAYGGMGTPEYMKPIECFDAFGFERQADNPSDFDFDEDAMACRFDLGMWAWEGSRTAKFLGEDHPEADWLAALLSAAGSPEVLWSARSRGVQLIVGVHDGDPVIVT